MKGQLKSAKGITLIALVITIIVLLILAGVTIATLTGENGILTRASEASKQTEIAGEKEAIEIAYIGIIANNGKNSVSDLELQKELENNGYDTKVTYNEDGTLNVLFNDTKNNYNVDDGKVSETVLTEQRMDLENGTIETVDLQTNEIIEEEKIAILKTNPGFGGSSLTEVYFVDSGEQDPKQYLKDTYGVEEANILDVSYNSNCLPVYRGNVGTIYYVASQGNTYLNNEENGGGYRLLGAQMSLTSKKSLKKVDFTNLNTKYAVNMAQMFRFAGSDAEDTGEYLEIIYGSNFDTSNVKTMEYMYAQVGMKQIILPEKFNTKNVENMGYMFFSQHIESAVEIIDLGENFDTSNVTNMDNMFMLLGSNTLKVLDLGDKFDTSKVTDMALMFSGCGENSLETLNLGGRFKINDSISVSENLMFADCGDNTLKEIIYEDTIENFEKNCLQLVTAINNGAINSRPIIKCTDGNYEY